MGDQLQIRTKVFALQMIKKVDGLAKFGSVQVIARQVLRSSTSVGANYRAACRAKSRADFISKMKIVEEELDESISWMELLVDSGLNRNSEWSMLMKEANELTSMVVASIKTARHQLR